MAFRVDALTSVMILIITGVGFLIHVYSLGYMHDDPDVARFFAYLNLFTASMLILVLGDSLPLLFIGWEGVGLCSYLLIGFWYTDMANADAGRKAFIANRVGDAAFLVGMFLLFWSLHAARHAVAGFRRHQPPGAAARRARRRRSSPPSACCCSSAPPASRRRSRSTSGCPTRWPARRRSRR